MHKYDTCHFWVGRLPEALANEYFSEMYNEEDEDTHLSLFGRDQGEKWYDHDYLEYGYSETEVTIQKLVEGYSYSDQWAEEFARRVADAGLSGCNWFAFINQEEVDQPRSVQGEDYWVHYLGTITYSI